jgi:hypothetical protein
VARLSPPTTRHARQKIKRNLKRVAEPGSAPTNGTGEVGRPKHIPQINVAQIIADTGLDRPADLAALRKGLEWIYVWFKNRDEFFSPKSDIDRRESHTIKLSKAAATLLELINGEPDARPVDPDWVECSTDSARGVEDRTLDDCRAGSGDAADQGSRDLFAGITTWELLRAELHRLKRVSDAETARQRALRNREIAPWLTKDWLIRRLASLFEKHFRKKPGYTRNSYSEAPAEGPFISFVGAVCVELGYSRPHPDTIAKALSRTKKKTK